MENSKKYDKMIYNSSLVDVDSYVNEKLDKIHEQIFLNALNKKIFQIVNGSSEFSEYVRQLFNGADISLTNFLKFFKVKEIRDDEFFKPSKIIVKGKKFPFIQKTFDLSQEWNDFETTIVSKSKNQKIPQSEYSKYAKIIYVDYVNGKSKLFDKMSGEEFWVDNDYLSGKEKIDEDFSLRNTFTKMSKNI